MIGAYIIMMHYRNNGHSNYLAAKLTCKLICEQFTLAYNFGTNSVDPDQARKALD